MCFLVFSLSSQSSGRAAAEQYQSSDRAVWDDYDQEKTQNKDINSVMDIPQKWEDSKKIMWLHHAWY